MMKERKILFWAAAILIVAVGLGLWALWSALTFDRANNYATQLTQAWKDAADAKATLLKVATAQKAAEASAISTPAAKTAATAETLKLATVGKGEGIEHAFIRQIVANPKDFGFDGDVNNRTAVKKWAGREAHRIALKAGYVDSDGREIRVKVTDKVAFVLNKDAGSNLMVAEYEKDASGNFKNDPTDESTVKAEGATFEGDTTDGVQGYEYVYSPPSHISSSASSPSFTAAVVFELRPLG